MFDIAMELKEQLSIIKQMIAETKKRQKEYADLPEGKIRVNSSNGNAQYLLAEKNASKAHYLPAKQKELAIKMMQREYDLRAIRILEKDAKAIERFIRSYDPKSIDRFYDGLCKERKEHIKPLRLTDELFVEKWLSETPGETNTYPEKGRFETELGERVRSKSEKIIADTLFRMNVPYRYEPCVLLKNNRYIYPDFACLNIKKRKTVYWEHLGLMDQNEYAVKNHIKIENYENSGILLGDSLIISLETAEDPLSTSLIREKIKHFLL